MLYNLNFYMILSVLLIEMYHSSRIFLPCNLCYEYLIFFNTIILCMAQLNQKRFPLKLFYDCISRFSSVIFKFPFLIEMNRHPLEHSIPDCLTMSHYHFLLNSSTWAISFMDVKAYCKLVQCF